MCASRRWPFARECARFALPGAPIDQPAQSAIVHDCTLNMFFLLSKMRSAPGTCGVLAGWALCPAGSPKVSSRGTRYTRCRPSRSPTVHVNNMPTCQSRARPRLSGSSRRPAHTHTHTRTRTATHTHKHAHTHTTRTRTRTRTRNARTNARTPARTRTPRTHKPIPTRLHTDPPGRSTAIAATASVAVARRPK